ncbi:hypothetical protein ACFQX6_22245 [Streptosporangium lutulentum]
MQAGDVAGPLLPQVSLENVREELVIAIPPAAVIKRDQEQVPSLQPRQLHRATVLTGDGLTQRAAQPVQDGGLQQEVPDGFGQASQDLLGQVVDDVPVIPGEARDERGDVVSPPHRERRQLKRGDPPLRTPLQRCDIPCRQHQSHHPVEIRRGLLGCEAQVGGTDLDELATPS